MGSILVSQQLIEVIDLIIELEHAPEYRAGVG
jgi:hypothetical protein